MQLELRNYLTNHFNDVLVELRIKLNGEIINDVTLGVKYQSNYFMFKFFPLLCVLDSLDVYSRLLLI